MDIGQGSHDKDMDMFQACSTETDQTCILLDGAVTIKLLYTRHNYYEYA